MITNLQAKFGIVRDTRSVPDPWGFGIRFELARIDSREYQEYVKRRQADSPIFQAMFSAIGRAQLRAAGQGNRRATPEIMAEAYEEAARNLNLKPNDLEAFTGIQREGLAKYLIRDITGLADLKGAPIKFSPEVALELLDSPEVVVEGLPYAGKRLGDALVEYLFDEAAKHESYREAALIQGGKASGPPTDGGSETSSDATPQSTSS